SGLIWFIDSDCVAHSDALQQLLPHLSEPEVAGVGGSYSNLFPESLLVTRIHEEIVARHRRMPREVDFLGGFNVLYLRTTLIALGGYDELATNGPGLAGAEDCDLSFRVSHSGSKLRFEKNSRVGHHHPRRIFPYLRTQARHGRFRVQLYLRHTAEIRGDSYTSMWDNLQPPMAMLSLAAIPFSVLLPWGIYLFLGLILLLMFLQCPMAFELAIYSLRAGLTYIPFGFARAYSRGLGMTLGVLSTLLDWQDQVAPRQTNTRRLNGSGNKANQSH
ncbi:MAG: glycosyltransferase, partial [Planctomycetaceae bacterium]|nr:glycosyltransferase [Planctomycetaceae bacterium]